MTAPHGALGARSDLDDYLSDAEIFWEIGEM
jgi:hypothetical protein